MQMPRLAMPRISLGALGERSTLWYGLYTFILFLVFLVVTFPHEVLVRRAIEMVPPQAPVRIEFDGARFAWLRGIEIENVRISGPDVPAPYVEIARLWLRPSLGDLIKGDVNAVELEAEVYGGRGSGVLHNNAGVISGIIQVDDVSLGRYTLLRSYLQEGTVGGRMSARLDFSANGNDLSVAHGSGELTLNNATLEGAKVQGFGIPDLHLDLTRLAVSLQRDQLEIKELTAKGKEISVDASGQISMRQPVEDSMLNLRAVIAAGPEAPDSIKGLLSMLPKPAPGQDQALKITGPLLRPKLR